MARKIAFVIPACAIKGKILGAATVRVMTPLGSSCYKTTAEQRYDCGGDYFISISQVLPQKQDCLAPL